MKRRVYLSLSFTIYDQDDSLRLIKQCIKELGFDEKYLAQLLGNTSVNRHSINSLARIPVSRATTTMQADRTRSTRKFSSLGPVIPAVHGTSPAPSARGTTGALRDERGTSGDERG